MGTVGVDVGGTKVAVALLEGDRLEHQMREETRLASSDALIDQIGDLVDGCGPAEAVGVGVPSVIDFATGRIKSSVNVPLADVKLREVLEQRLGVPVFVDNDATVAALAEAEAHAARHLVMLTLGTGVGGGVIIDGQVFRGATGAAPELGHWILGADLEGREPDWPGPPAKDRFPQPGSFETLCSGRAIDALAHERGHADGKALTEAAQDGDVRARHALAIVGRRLGVGIANVINAFDPEVVAVGGGAAAAGDLILEPARETAKRFTLTGVGEACEIRPARSGPHAGVRGAALLARQEHERRRTAGPDVPPEVRTGVA